MTTTTATAFGRVLTELLEERGLEATPETVGQPVIDRMADADADYPGSMEPIALALDLDREEMIRLSLAGLRAGVATTASGRGPSGLRPLRYPGGGADTEQGEEVERCLVEPRV